MGRDYLGGKSGSRRTMYPAICDKCGAACNVPFQPSGDKPIYCSNCFEKTDSREGRNDRYGAGPRRYGDDSRDRQMHQATCATCGDRCEVPFRPTGDKPVYCKNCFAGHKPTISSYSVPANFGGSSNDKVVKQLELLNTKLDKLILILTPEEHQMGMAEEIINEPEKSKKPKKANTTKKTKTQAK